MKKYFFIIFLIVSVFSIYCQTTPFGHKLSEAAISIENKNIIYDPKYFVITYPNGDVPYDRGVCTDVIIRAYRKLGIDLQKEVHLDMKNNFSKYPKKWNRKSTDRNIDHRRVPNLMVFFTRKGIKKPITDKADDYIPGDIVCWNLQKGVTHIGIVVNQKSDDNKRYLIIHNIGNGQIIEDILFKYKIIGHFYYNNE